MAGRSQCEHERICSIHSPKMHIFSQIQSLIKFILQVLIFCLSLCPLGYNFHSLTLQFIHFLRKVQRMNGQGKRSMDIKVFFTEIIR